MQSDIRELTEAELDQASGGAPTEGTEYTRNDLWWDCARACVGAAATTFGYVPS